MTEYIQDVEQFLKNIHELNSQNNINIIKIPIIKSNKQKEQIKICSFNSDKISEIQKQQNNKLQKLYKFINEQEINIFCLQKLKTTYNFIEKKFKNYYNYIKNNDEDKINANNYIILTTKNVNVNEDVETIIYINKNHIQDFNKHDDICQLNLQDIIFDQFLQEEFVDYLKEGRIMFLLYQINNQNLLIINLCQKCKNNHSQTNKKLDFYQFLPKVIKQIKQQLINEKKIEQEQEFRTILCGCINQKGLITIPRTDNSRQKLNENDNETWKQLINTYYLSNESDENKFKKDFSIYQNQQERNKKFQEYIENIKEKTIDYIFIDEYKNLAINWELYDPQDQGIKSTLNHNFIVLNLIFDVKKDIKHQNEVIKITNTSYNSITILKEWEQEYNNKDYTLQHYLEENNSNIQQQQEFNNQKIEDKIISKQTSEGYKQNKIVESSMINFTQQDNKDKKDNQQQIEAEAQILQQYQNIEKYIDQTTQTFVEVVDNTIKEIQENNSQLQDKLYQYCQKYKVDKDIIINNPGWQDNEYKQTFAMELAWNKIIPPEQFQHDPKLQNKWNDTVAVYLEKNNISTLQQWLYDPLYKLKDESTTAMRIALYGIIPSKYWEHDSNIKDKFGNTVALYLSQRRIIPLKQWQVDPNIIYKYRDSDNNYIYVERTIAHILSSQGVIPPKEWQHNPNFKDNLNKTVEDYLKENKINVPDNWKTIKQQQIQLDKQLEQYLDDYCKRYEVNKQIILDNPDWQSYLGQTLAMYLADNKVIPPTIFEHNPLLKDDNGNTVAIYLACNGITPQLQWQHDKNIANRWGFTVQDYLQSNNIYVPNEWQTNDYEIENKTIIDHLIDYCKKYKINKNIIINNPEWQDNKEKETFALYLLDNDGIIPPKQFIYDPNIKGGYNNQTVREYLQDNELPIPNEWYDDKYKQNHNYQPQYLNDALNSIITKKPDNVKPETQYEGKQTVAMIYANQGIIPPKCWNHKPELQDFWGNTVAILLIKNKVFNIPKQWEHNPYITNQFGNTIQGYLKQKDKEIPEQWKVENNIKQELKDYCYEYNINKYDIIQNPGWQNNNDKQTFAMWLAQKSITPPEFFQHNPKLQDIQGNTIAKILRNKQIKVPNNWKDDSEIENQFQQLN